jgi:integrase
MAISCYTQNDQIFYQVYVIARGKRNFRDTRIERKRRGFKTEAEAKQTEKKLLRQIQEELHREMFKGLTWRMIIKKWEDHNKVCLNGQSDSYVQDALCSINKWTDSWFDLALPDIGSPEVFDLFQNLSAQKKAISYQRKIKRRISEIFEWAVRHKISPAFPNPLTEIKFKEGEEKFPEILQKADISNLLNKAKLYGHEWYPIWFTAVYSGMRTGELQALETSSVDFESNIINVHSNFVPVERRNPETHGLGPTKGRYWRQVPMNRTLREFLLKLLKENNGGFTDPKFPDKRFVFPRLKMWQSGHQAEILRDFCGQIEIPSVCFHTLRACFATHLLRQGVTTALVMKVAGWKNFETMERYIRLSGIEINGMTDGLNYGEDIEETADLKMITVKEAITDFNGFSA